MKGTWRGLSGEADTTCMESEKPDLGWIAVSNSGKAQWITGSTESQSETSQKPQVRGEER